MRLSHFHLHTTKETPADAEIVSHQLMLRAGMIRRLAAGLYTWSPLGLRVLRKVEAIVREEMDRSGAIELLMPTIQPKELWQETGRWQKFGPQLLKIRDRKQAEYCYAPTAEEVITDFARNELASYKQLPVNLYQIQTKFRDEIRPRFGVMRAREFLMKDAYSFHMTEEDLVREYENMRQAYMRVFTRLGLDFRAVKADAGNIGGHRSEEFHVLANAGEDLLAVSTESDYAANVEAAETRPPGQPRPAPGAAMVKVATPGQKTCEQVSRFLGVPLTAKVKLLVAKAAGGGLIGIALRGDHRLNEIKAARHPKIASPFEMARAEDVEAAFGCEVGYLGPVHCPVPVIADFAAAALADFVCGANENDHHLKGVNWGRDGAEPETADLRMIEEGDPSPDGRGTIRLLRGIEGGHIFQLGRAYTQAMGFTVLDAEGRETVPEMGCYGIGVSRLVAATIEQCHDPAGIIWPASTAPFTLLICPIGFDKSEAVRRAAEQLYMDVLAAGIDVALDDRGLRPGPMFADADLIGIPHRVVIGDKGLGAGQFEYKRRGADPVEMLPATSAAVLERLRH